MIVSAASRLPRVAPRLCVPPPEPGHTEKMATAAGALFSKHYTDPAVGGTLHLMQLDWLALGRVRAGAHRIEYDPRSVSRPAKAQLHVLFQVFGCSVLEHGEQPLQIESGSFVVIEANRGYAIMSRQRSERIILVIEQERLQRTPPGAAGMKCRLFPAHSGFPRVLFSAVTSVADEAYDIGIGHASMLAGQLTELLQEILHHEPSLRIADETDIRLRDVQEYVTRNLRDPRLNVDQIAQALQWSRRTLTRIYAKQGESLSQYICRLRLEGALRDMRDPTHRRTSLTDIALDWGFSSYWQFGQRFRQHYKLTPLQARNRPAC